LEVAVEAGVDLNHVEGGGEEVYGTSSCSSRPAPPSMGSSLDARHIPFSGEGGEAGAALTSFSSTAPRGR